MKLKICHLLICALAVAVPAASVAGEAAKVKYARGAVTVQKADGSDARLVGADDLILEGEVVKTGPKSFAILNLQDDTKMTLRPKTTFAIEEMNAKKDSTASTVMRLFRGGLRTVTGYISKLNPNGYRVRTSVATIGIRGTDFDARLCEQDCQEENEKIEKKKERETAETVARIVFKRGDLNAQAYAGRTRELQTGDSVFEGDTISTGSSGYAIIVFRDKSRVSLNANSEFRVDELKYSEENEKEQSALFSLLRGGLRTVTGLIGKLNPKKYQMRTSVATIGIRGTGYDLLCTGACVAEQVQEKPTPKIDMPEGDGLYANVWDGAIQFGSKPLKQGQAGWIKDRYKAPVVLPTIPDFFRNNPVPQPDKFEVDESTLFVKGKTQKIDPGLYVSVDEGEVAVEAVKTKKTIKLTKGMSGYAGPLGDTVQQLPFVPAFQRFDTIPKPDITNFKAVQIGTNVMGDTGDKELICEVK